MVAPVQLKTCKPIVIANALWHIYTSSGIKLTTNSSNDEEEKDRWKCIVDLSPTRSQLLPMLTYGESVLTGLRRN